MKKIQLIALIFVVLITAICIIGYKSINSPCTVSIKIKNNYGSAVDIHVYDYSGKISIKDYKVSNDDTIIFSGTNSGVVLFDVPIDGKVLMFSEYDHWFASHHNEIVTIHRNAIDFQKKSMKWRKARDLYHI
jgi:hypothetical protein